MKNNKIKWEIWSKEGELAYYASSTDEGMQIYHEKMGFEPYKSARQ